MAKALPKAKTIAMPLAYGIGLAMQFPISSDNDHSKDNCNGIGNENYYNSRLFLNLGWACCFWRD